MQPEGLPSGHREYSSARSLLQLQLLLLLLQLEFRRAADMAVDTGAMADRLTA
jgi:hypothetical protein